MNRKNSFIVIEIMEQKTPKDCMDHALGIINKELSLLTYLRYLNYYLITCYASFIRYFYTKKFDIYSVVVKDAHFKRMLSPEQNFPNELLILDNGITFYGFFVPYENILQYACFSNKCYIEMYVQVELKNKEITLTLDKKRTMMTFRLHNSKLASQLSKSMKMNMYYHIKFNKINIKVLEYYIDDENHFKSRRE